MLLIPTIKATGKASGEAIKAVNEAQTCGDNCDGDKLSQVRPILKIFGTIMESIVVYRYKVLWIKVLWQRYIVDNCTNKGIVVTKVL